ncbi:cation:proton antiporter [cf. Phormidesmis sp. LEGE 11477]|uniref:cation:proton antiporter n=1 Tax=cf. Phormidesmis sp. LEGE 11477 TaxID=1828680 RepID=UPI001D14D04F|nr:cation:proton antiporter [cf. Phormidesmis sp. LEGE 11477]
MASELVFTTDLMLVLGAAATGGYIVSRLGQPVLLGYLGSGLVIGPLGLNLIRDTANIQELAEIGVAFLLFALGVQFSLEELNRVRNIALQGSLLQIGITTGLVTTILLSFGWVDALAQGIFWGALLSLSSTAVALKTLTERGETNTRHGQIMLAILIAQDLALGLMLAVVPAINQPGPLWQVVGFVLLKVTSFLVAAVLVGRFAIPVVIRQIALTESNELFLLTLIALCLSVAIVTARLGLSIEIGAFVAGLMIAEVDYADQALGKVLPLRDTFASLFFVSIGMLIDPEVLIQNLGKILSLVSLVMVGKALVILPIVLLFGYSLKTAVLTSCGINQIGEFSFVLAVVGLENELITQETYLLLLGTTAITLVLTPTSLQLAEPLIHWVHQQPQLMSFLRKLESSQQSLEEGAIANHVVVAGYGRVGGVVVELLHRQNHPVLVLENSEAAVQSLRRQRIPFVMGDADAELILARANLTTAKALVIALPDPMSTRLLLKRARAIAPKLDIIARAHTTKELDQLSQLGAQEVVQPEFEAALALCTHLLATLGQIDDQLGMTMAKIRADHYQAVRRNI